MFKNPESHHTLVWALHLANVTFNTFPVWNLDNERILWNPCRWKWKRLPLIWRLHPGTVIFPDSHSLIVFVPGILNYRNFLLPVLHGMSTCSAWLWALWSDKARNAPVANRENFITGYAVNWSGLCSCCGNLGDGSGPHCCYISHKNYNSVDGLMVCFD